MHHHTKPTKEELLALDLRTLTCHLQPDRVQMFLDVAGNEHYRLLAWWSTRLLYSRIAEFGTLDGVGAVALAYSEKNLVVTHDIRLYPDHVSLPWNAVRRVIHSSPPWEELDQFNLIFYDAHHDGAAEAEFVSRLQQDNWHGVLIFDDIHFNEPMKRFWEQISLPKEDWTDVGHHSGTGIIYL